MIFEKGSYVVYGINGICKVEDIRTLNIDGIPKDRLYYVLIPTQRKESEIFTPVHNQKVQMRKILNKQEAEQLIDQIPEVKTLWIQNEREREQCYKQYLRTCDCMDCVRIIKTLYLRKRDRLVQGKKVTAVDERYLKMAEENLYAELALVFELSEEQMEAYITKRLEKKKQTKAITS